MGATSERIGGFSQSFLERVDIDYDESNGGVTASDSTSPNLSYFPSEEINAKEVTQDSTSASEVPDTRHKRPTRQRVVIKVDELSGRQFDRLLKCVR